ncbi:MAG: SDR family oxidoreductase [Gemmatimonadaceae bacterium]
MDLLTAKALVTGGSSGIGLETARALIARGARVAISARHASKLEQAAAELGAVPIQADVSNEDDVIRMVETTVRELGGYDVLINNAGFGVFGPLLESTAADYRRVWETNVLGAMLVARESARHFVRERRGNIVNIASTSGQHAGPGGGAYASTKFALSALTESWRAELREHSIRVMQVNPSQVLTDFVVNSGRPARPYNPTKLHAEDIAHVIVGMLELHDRGFVTEATVWATNPKD